MDHVVYLEASAHELENLLSGKKDMIVRGAMGRKMPYGRVDQGDVLYFLNNNAEGLIRAQAVVKSVLNSDPLSEDESVRLLADHQPALQLTDKQLKRWSGKRYLVLIEVGQVEPTEPFAIDKSNYGNMDDWLLVGKIETVKK